MVKGLLSNSKALLLRRQTNILSAAFIIMVAYATSSVLGLIRNRLLAAEFFGGQESQLDAYFAAFVIPDTLFQLLITGALSAAFIPVFSKYLKKDEAEASEIASGTITIISALFIVLITIFFLLSTQISGLLAPSLDAENLLLLSRLLRFFLLAQIFFAGSGFLTAIIQSHQRFLVPAISPIVYNLSIIGGIVFLSPYMGIFGPAVGVILGAFLHLIIQLPLAYKLGFRFHIPTNLTHPGIIQILRLMPPRSLTLVVGQAERFVAVFVATGLTAGSLTIFNFAKQLYLLPVTLFGTTIGQASFPTLSKEMASENNEEFRQTIRASILQVLYFTLPAAVIVLILRLPVVRIAYGAKNFPWDATLLTGKIVALLSLAIPSLSINAVLTRAFYAMHDTKTPLGISFIGALMTAIFGIILAQTMGLGLLGLAAVITIVNAFQSTALLVGLNKKSKFININFMFSSLKMILATISTGVFLWVPMRIIDRFVLDTTRTINLLMLTASVLTIGMVVYLNISAILKIEQLSEVIALGRRIGNWKNILNSSEEVIEATSIEKQSS